MCFVNEPQMVDKDDGGQQNEKVQELNIVWLFKAPDLNQNYEDENRKMN